MKTKLFFVLTIAITLTSNLQKANAQNWMLNGNSNATSASKLGTLNNYSLKLYTNGSEQMTITTAGNVGIGTTSPVFKLDINYGSNNAAMRIVGTDHPAFVINSTSLSTRNSGKDLYILGDAEPFGSHFSSGNVILQADTNKTWKGNVGIGITTPLQKLHVVGASIIATNTTINPSTTANTVIAGAIKDGSGWSITSGIGGKAGGAGQEWGIGAIGNSLYFGFGNGSADNTMQTGIQIMANRNVLLIPGASGNVAIGTATPATGYMLSIAGKVICTEAKVQAYTNWPDYVFEDNYKLLSLNELKYSIQLNKHLPEIPSSSEVAKNNGIEIGDMQEKLLKKIEELTLYILQLHGDIESLKADNHNLHKSLDELSK